MSEKRDTLPQGWEWKKLGDLSVLITKGSTPTTYGYKYVDKGINFIKIENISDGKIQLHTIQNFITEEAHQSQRRSILQENDILFSIAGTIGESCIVSKGDLPANTNQALAVIRLEQDINPHYARLLLSSEVLDEIRNKQRGGALKNISLEDVKNALIPLPPLEEQRRIVGVLDGLFGKIDKSIALLDESIASASSLMPSALNEVFEELKIKNEMVMVKQVIVNIQTGTTPSKQIEKYYKVPLEIEWFSPSDFKEEKILHNSKNKLNKIALEERKVKLYDENSLLLVAIGATVGKIGVIREKATSNQQITALKFDNSVNVDFAYYWFKHIKEFIIGQASTATLPIINQNGIKELPFIKVPLDIQTQTVAYLDALHVKAEALKKAQEKKKEALLALKASLLESAFKGAL